MKYRIIIFGYSDSIAHSATDAMKKSSSREDFIILMKRKSYKVRWEDGRRDITFTCPNGIMCRGSRLHQEKFRKENIENEFRLRKEQFERYGYKKKAADSKEIIPDEETAPVVQYIFNLCAGGKGPSQIARILSDEKILTPAHYNYRTYGTMTAGMDMDRPYAWSGTSIAHILCNMVYLGHTHTMKNTTISFKNKTRIAIPEENTDMQLLA